MSAASRSSHPLLRDRLLATFVEHGPMSRASAARASSLPASTVRAVITELMAEGAVWEVPEHRSPGGRGRPARLIAARRSARTLAAIDIGHRHLRAAIATSDGHVLAERVVAVDADVDVEATLSAAESFFTELIDETSVPKAVLGCVGIGMPGTVDTVSRRVGTASLLASWAAVQDVCGEFERRLGLPVAIGNDASLGALGEWTYGCAQHAKDFIYVKVSNGIGAGFVLGGRLYTGSSGTAGEVGHTQIDPYGPWCRCGNRGCLEAIVSIEVIGRELESFALDPSSDEDANHPVVAKILEESGRVVGAVVANLCNTLDPECVVLGGDVVRIGRHFIAGVRESVRRFAEPSSGAGPTVVTTGLQGRAELLGALALAASMTDPESASPVHQLSVLCSPELGSVTG